MTILLCFIVEETRYQTRFVSLESINSMCGINGVIDLNGFYAPKFIDQALKATQHRGYDGYGKTVAHHTHMLTKHKLGLVEPGKKESGNIAIGHIRYKTSGTVDLVSCQPFANERFALVHNGQIESDTIPDSKKLFHYFEKSSLKQEELFYLVSDIMKEVKGSYSCIVLVPGVGLLAFRDPQGIRPLLYHIDKKKIVITSENCGWANCIDLRPGECILFRLDGTKTIRQLADSNPHPCIFEYIYFAHPLSILNGISVQVLRRQLGTMLGQHIQNSFPALEIDYVVPVPQSACLGTQALAEQLHKPYRNVLMVTEDSSTRSFIQSSEEKREERIKRKFRLTSDIIKGKNVILSDDTIVRGNSSKHLVNLFREAGASKIIVCSLAPPVVHRNIYGIDVPNEDNLVACKDRPVHETIGADQVIYQPFDSLISLAEQYQTQFEQSMFIKHVKAND